ncbi:amino acid adenylation domain-containing protein [Nostoc sp. UCD121]|uniref:non-ribosomal peptide synthetase n=1 Tax=unclassified Nostoc TaxID=2593658 RepID=UPI0016283770|nr:MULTISPECIES: non-ribosomal peptide synthetase [unclassified Nostoc]MBC1218644.1 amino acid adenylation domain-containing protein [Nostoc sp. UCD120]MBC1274878.1 amino acid adenylation domain-containing protein [Nostoc sp. UCD121]MBC1293588.1 amino acid adenylation domain-containing protein [Nostoc sp. UCD122]
MVHPFNGLKDIVYSCSTLVDILQYRCRYQPHKEAFNFLQDEKDTVITLTYQELHRRSRAIASQLQSMGMAGKRALLLYPPGLDFVAGFFGCLYAGVVAVPAYPPRNQRNTPRIQAIIADAQAAIGLTTTNLLPKMQSLLGNLQWLATDNLSLEIETTWQVSTINQDSLAFLQYTSGSTGTPKGVMVSHGNLLHNCEYIKQAFELTSESVSVTWLPSFHDMGLIDGILQPLYTGFLGVLMPPGAFIQRPIRWLEAISRYGATHCGGPNFAYELCVNKITPEQQRTLDLSSWRTAYSGAEPIRRETLERFATFFEPCGFQPSFFYPCYGMAEATLMVSGGEVKDEPVYCAVETDALEQNQVVKASKNSQNVRHLVGCGHSWLHTKIVIVDPESLTLCPANRVGEIWVSGASVAQGYWKKQEETAQTFHAYLKDTGVSVRVASRREALATVGASGPFLRTGDLGFLDNGELFITGRVKDLIIIRGRNLYPQDIELTAERSHPSLRLGSCAAFAVEVDNEEHLVVVQELEFRAKPNHEEVISAIRQAVAEEHEIQAYAVVLIKPGTIHKTSSGKIQRRATKAAFIVNNLDIVASNITKRAEVAVTENKLQRQVILSLTPRERQPVLEAYIQEQVAQVLSIPLHEVNLEQAFSSFGLDSLKAFELKNRIENHLEITLSIADFFTGLTARSLSTKILAQLKTDAISSEWLLPVHKDSEFHPLSFAQQRLWFIHQLTSDTPAYNIPLIIRFQGSVNVAVLEQSLNEIIRRHEILRTNFIVVDGQPVQVVQPDLSIKLLVEDLQKLPQSDRTTKAHHLTKELAQQTFDLSSQPLFRVQLLRIGEAEYQLVLILDHIVVDGWSIGILTRELAAIYEAFVNNQPSPLPELPIQYLDFTYWQRQWLQGERLQTLIAYWKQQLGGSLPVLDLPTDKPRGAFPTFNGAQAKLVLSPSLSAELKNLCQQEGATLFMVLLAAFKTLLYRYTGQTDILVGSAIASRNRAELDSLIGFFVNILVLRTSLDGVPTFRELLERVKAIALEAYTHQDLPFEKLVEELQPERHLSYNPLFQVMFVLQNVPLPTPKLSDIDITFEEGFNDTSKFDLTLFMEDREQGLIATLEYDTDLFGTDTMHRMLGHLQTLLEAIVANPNQSIAELPLLTGFERKQILVDWNQTQTEYPQHLCIHQLFEQQVEITPNAVALVFENQRLTYRELNNQANQLADYLQKLGVKPEICVGICMERSPEMVIGLLAIIKAGGAYVPLDPKYPQERLAFMLEDSQTQILLTQTHLVKCFADAKVNTICLDSDWQFREQQNTVNLFSGATSKNLAYIIYTSGSTGKPKGVAIEHRSCIALLTWARKVFADDELVGVLASTSICFDLSVFELFVPLSWGGKVILVENALHLPNSPAATEVTLVNTVPSIISELLRINGLPISVRTLNLAGEPLQHQLVQQIYQNDAVQKVFNLYGPSEDTTYSTFTLVERGDKIVTIGRPIDNTQVYLLDGHLQPVPIGVKGEIYIAGAGLARGYLNRPEVTTERFIANSFDNELNARLYKTGDLGRYLPNGNLEYLGRIDYQVKIRGFRIELGEIEKVLIEYSAVREVIVLALEKQSDDKHLVAYFVPEQEQTPTTNELRNYLKGTLPDYMVPAIFVQLDAMPMLPNGKVNRGALQLPTDLYPEITVTYEAPNSEMERAIANIWQEVLKLEKVGINDNFFDLGGHSLLMVQVKQKLDSAFHKELSIIELFQHSTIHSLAKYLRQDSDKDSPWESIRERTQKQRNAIIRKQQLLSSSAKKKL